MSMIFGLTISSPGVSRKQPLVSRSGSTESNKSDKVNRISIRTLYKSILFGLTISSPGVSRKQPLVSRSASTESNKSDKVNILASKLYIRVYSLD